MTDVSLLELLCSLLFPALVAPLQCWRQLDHEGLKAVAAVLMTHVTQWHSTVPAPATATPAFCHANTRTLQPTTWWGKVIIIITLISGLELRKIVLSSKWHQHSLHKTINLN